MMSRPPKLSTAAATKRSPKSASVTLPTQRDSLPARGLDRGDCLLGGFGVEVVDHYPRALAGQLQRDLAPDPTAGAGDDSDLAFKSSHG